MHAAWREPSRTGRLIDYRTSDPQGSIVVVIEVVVFVIIIVVVIEVIIVEVVVEIVLFVIHVLFVVVLLVEFVVEVVFFVVVLEFLVVDVFFIVFEIIVVVIEIVVAVGSVIVAVVFFLFFAFLLRFAARAERGSSGTAERGELVAPAGAIGEQAVGEFCPVHSLVLDRMRLGLFIGSAEARTKQ